MSAERKTKGDAEGRVVKVTFAGKTSARRNFNAKLFAETLMRSRRGGSKAMTFAEREAWTKSKESEFGRD